MNDAAALFLCAAVALAGCGGGGSGGGGEPLPPPPPADDARPPEDGGAAPPRDDGSDVTPPDGDPRFPGGQKESPPPTDGQGGLRGPDGQPAPRSDPDEPSPAPSGPDGNPPPPPEEPGGPPAPEPEEPRPEPGEPGQPTAPEPSSPRPAPAEPHPAMLAPGIERIPLEALKLSNTQLASRYAVLEYRAGNDGGATRDGAGTRHGDEVRTVACASFARPCADPFDDESAPFTFHLGKQEFVENTAAQTEELLRRLSEDVKLVSISIEPRKPGGVVETQGRALAFAVVQSAGNNGRDTFFDQGVEPLDDGFSGFLDDGAPVSEALREAWDNIVEAVENDKVLYVAGYVETGGNFARHDESTACAGVQEGCLYAPFVLSDGKRDYRGTSFGAPHVASALASVLAMFPDTAGTDLIRVAKACAIRTPSLSDGLGRADFGCMTVMDDNGQWRAAASLEEALDNAGGGAPAPAAMNAMTFPGDAALRAAFEGPNGARVTLATRRPGAFRFSAGPPAPLPGGAREAGFFPIAAEDDGASSFGGGWLSESGLFAAAAYGRTGAFFGLGERFGWTGARALDAAAGHRNLFVRVSRQRARGRHVHEAEGAALGATVRALFALTPALDASVSAHVDRFAGGFARTAFGDVEIAPSPWSREARAALRYAPLPAASVSVQAAFRRHADGDRATEARAHVQLRF